MKFLFLLLSFSFSSHATISSGTIDYNKVNRGSLRILEDRNQADRCEFNPNRSTQGNYHPCQNLEDNICRNYGYLARLHGQPSPDIRDRPMPNFETDGEEYVQMLSHTQNLVTPLFLDARPFMARFIKSKGGAIGRTSRSIERVELLTEGKIKFLSVEEEAFRHRLPANSKMKNLDPPDPFNRNTWSNQGLAVKNYVEEITAHPNRFTEAERAWAKVFLIANFKIAIYNHACSGNSRNAFMAQSDASSSDVFINIDIAPTTAICNREILTAATRTSDPKNALTFIMFHELAHTSDSTDDPRVHHKFEQCLEEKQFRNHQQFSTQRKDLIADRLAIDAMTEYMEEKKITAPDKVLSFLKDNYQIICGAGESDTHPSGEFRMNNLLMRTPKIRKLLGCVDEKPVDHCEL